MLGGGNGVGSHGGEAGGGRGAITLAAATQVESQTATASFASSPGKVGQKVMRSATDATPAMNEQQSDWLGIGDGCQNAPNRLTVDRKLDRPLVDLRRERHGSIEGGGRHSCGAPSAGASCAAAAGARAGGRYLSSQVV